MAIEARLRDGETRFQRGDYTGAAASFRGVLALLPSQTDAKQGAALAGLKGDADYPRYLAAVHDNLGVALLRARRFDEAAEAIGRAIAIDPNRALFHANLGTCRFRSKRYDEAASAFERALELQPGTADEQVQLGETYVALGRTEQAVRVLQDALTHLPKPDLQGIAVDAWLALGTAHAELGQHDRAIDALARALQLAPGTNEAWYQLSRLLARQGRSKEADAAATRFKQLREVEKRLDSFRSLPSLTPEQIRAYATLLQTAGLPHQSLTQLAKLVRWRSDDPCPWLEQARLQQALGGHEQAVASYRRVLELRRGCREASDALHRLGASEARPSAGAPACCEHPGAPSVEPPPDQQDQEHDQKQDQP